jgi:WD40 repeat protein
VTCLDFFSPHEALVTGSEDATIRLWDLGSWHPMRTLHGHQGAVRCIQYDGSTMVSGGDDRKLCVWRMPDFSTAKSVSIFDNSKDDDWLACQLQGHYGPILCLQFDRPSAQLVSYDIIKLCISRC